MTSQGNATTSKRISRRAAKSNGAALHSRLNALKSDLGELQKDVRGLAGDAGDEATARVSTALTHAMDSARAMSDRFDDWSSDRLAAVRTSVRERPLVSCAFSAGVGTIIGAVLLRR